MKAGLLGRKLGHSLSPQIHRLFGDYEYRLFEKEPDEVETFVRTADLDFLNVTIPYKQTVFALCDELSPVARKLGNVNFIRRLLDGRLFGDNTDAFGVERLLDSVGADVRGMNCAILGAGGSALTVQAVLESRGAARVTFVRRGELPQQDDALVVNATPVGMFPDVGGVRIDVCGFPDCRFVLDLVYNPSPTRLVREARACGKVAADGLVMLIAQAYRAYVLASQSNNQTIKQSNNLFLYGPPASGKSTLARKVAAATGRTHVDLDAEVEAADGRTIPKIFAAEGESAFRAVERRVLERVVKGGNQVVALGGGALLDTGCRRIAEESGRVVVLECPLEVLKKRLTGGDRPLSADVAKLEALVAARAAHYASFPRHIRML